MDYSTICYTLNTSFIKYTKDIFHMNVELYLYLPSVKYSGDRFVTSILQMTSLRHRRLRNLCMGLYFMSNVWRTREAHSPGKSVDANLPGQESREEAIRKQESEKNREGG